MVMMPSFTLALFGALTFIALEIEGFTILQSRGSVFLFASGDVDGEPKKEGFFEKFFTDLDDFIDDATSRRLGAGAAFYGKRKSRFYGNDDTGRKRDRSVPDPTEDYQGPSQSGYFKWMPDEETGQLKPVTRLKGKNIERNPKFWDRVYSSEDE